MNKPDDTELERYLAGEHPVSAHYRRSADDTPPPELDAAIRRQARGSASRRGRRWLRPLAAAAVLIIGMGVVFELEHHPGAPAVPATGLADRAEPAQSRVLPSDRARILKQKLPVPAAGNAARGQVQSLTAPDGQPASAAPVPARPDAEAELARIRTLLETGRRDAATAALRHFLERRPNYPLEDRLARLAEAAGLRP